MGALQAHWGKARPGFSIIYALESAGPELKNPQGVLLEQSCTLLWKKCVCVHAHFKKKKERETKSLRQNLKIRRSHITPKLFLGVLLLLFYESESLSCGLSFPVTGPWAAEPVTQGTCFPAHQDSLPGPWKHPRVLPRNPCTDWRLTDMHWSLQAYIVRATEKNWVPRGEHPVWPGGKT